MPDFRSAVKLNSSPLLGITGSGSSFNVFTSVSGSLTGITAETDIPSTSMSVVVPGSNATIIARAIFGFQVTGSASTMTGFFSWGGSDLGGNAVITSDSATDLVMIPQTWVITGVSAGTYTAKLRASSSSTSNQAIFGLSSLTVVVLGNS